MKSFVRISALLWADILVAYALFVMQNYLSDVWKLSFTHAAGFLNVWNGIYLILPGFFLFLVDAFLGNFMMLVISSIAYSVGITFVTLSTPTFLGTCKEYEPQCIGHTQKVLFYIGMALLTVGISGHLVSLKPFLEEQEDRPDDGAMVLGILFAFIIVVIVPVTGAIALPYIKPWAIRFGIPAICTVFVTLLFFTGFCWGRYRRLAPRGSPITNVCRVFVACGFNISKPFPDDNRRLHRNDDQEIRTRTHFLRCLEKAAIIENEDRAYNRWRLCSIGEVEEAKIAVRMVPMWLTFIVVGIVSSIGNTYFLEQANKMNRNIGKWRVPLPIFKMLFDYAKQFFDSIAGTFLKPNRPRAPSVGLALAMIFSILCCITAASLENRRIKVIISHGLLDKPDDDIPMSMFWLLFQFFLLGGMDSFFHKSVAAFYADQAPESMKEYLSYFSKGVSGLGFMCSVLSVYVVGKVSERGGRTNWFQYTLNRSRLDRYYWFLAGLSAVNLVVFVIVASCYRYKNRGVVDRELVDGEAQALPQAEENNDEGGG